jgi:CheY-like chemotaxis protein
MTLPAPAAQPHILLLDDDAFSLELLRDMLESVGSFDVHSETDGRSALARIAQRAPDVMICDLSMPDMDGIEFLHAAASAGYRGRVMLVSGMDTSVRKAAERLARAQGLNVLGAWRKPMELADLQATLLPLVAPEGRQRHG